MSEPNSVALRRRDFIPIVGQFSYTNRCADISAEGSMSDCARYCVNYFLLATYNMASIVAGVAAVTGVLVGIDKGIEALVR